MKPYIAFLLFTIVSINMNAQVKVIAHRGYWDFEGSAQNSITALQKAAEINVYGSEFDVHITADSVAVIYHDDEINGKHIQRVPYDSIKDCTLNNGELFPTLEGYLEEGKKHPHVKLILEIKPHHNPERDKLAAYIISTMVNEKNLSHQVEYISFSMDICEELKKLVPSSPIYYLESDATPEELKQKGLTGLDYNHKFLSENPDYIHDAHELGLFVNVWTINDIEKMQYFIDKHVDFITTDKPEMLLNIIDKMYP